jgi:microcin C transport system permease protein
MRAYFLRRLLLIPPTLLGVTIVVFCITRFAPGGPVEQAIMAVRMAEHASRSTHNGGALNEDELQQLKAYYGFDQPMYRAYLNWLGKVLHGDLGNSFRYGEPVAQVIRERLPVSLTYGIITMVLTYGVCLPLGIVKAIRHRTLIDNATSVLVFVGYAIPDFALGSLLVVFLAARAGWFPMGGFVGEDFKDLSLMGKLADFTHHAVLPLTCYMVGSFAFVTFLVKNQLMDNLAADYVRTAVAKGVTFRRAVLHHAFRNSLIPIATNLGQSLTVLVGGSFLIETIFDIDGMGLLGYRSVLDRDFQVVMGVLLITSLLLFLGNLLGDLLVAVVDPRIRYH